jgi:hypothetical protein
MDMRFDIDFVPSRTGARYPYELLGVSERGLAFLRRHYLLGSHPVVGFMDPALELARIAGMRVNFCAVSAQMPERVM